MKSGSVYVMTFKPVLFALPFVSLSAVEGKAARFPSTALRETKGKTALRETK
jgi:hypothetical protein